MPRNFSPCESITSFDPATATLAIIIPRCGGFLLSFETSVAIWPFPSKVWHLDTEAKVTDQMEIVFKAVTESNQTAA